MSERPSKLRIVWEEYKAGGLWHVIREGTLTVLSRIAMKILPHLPAWDRYVDDQIK